MSRPTEADRNGPVLGFGAGTSVHTQQGLKLIEQIQVGDWVLSRPADDPPPPRRRLRQEYSYRRVTEVRRADSPFLALIYCRNDADGIEDILRAAPDQPIWSKADGWISADSMQFGRAVVLSFNGNALVMEAGQSAEPAHVYALCVEEFNTYYVEQLGTWVRSDGAGKKLTTPAVKAGQPFDFNKPQTLLKIKDYYNDTLAPAQPSAESNYVAPTLPLPEMQRAIDLLRGGYSQVQKRLNPSRLAALSAARPNWMSDADGLNEVLRRQVLLLASGEIVWGALIQANKLMFAPGNDDCPALLVYSTDRYFDAHPDELRAVGRQMFALKDTKPTDPVLRAAAELVSDEADRAMGFRLPTVFSAREISAATFMVFRQHIPEGVLSVGLFPILIHPSTQAVMIVPYEFWPASLLVMWNERRF